MDEESTWTAERVGECLVEEIRAMQGGAMILSHNGVTGYSVLDATSHCLRQSSLERKQLLSWANCQARDTSFSEICREFGWPRSSTERNMARVKAVIAAWLNLKRALEKKALDDGETSVGHDQAG